MSNTMGAQKIEPKQFKDSINNSNTLVEGFWVENVNPSAKNQEKIEVIKEAISLIKKAKKIIILYSPLITRPDLQIELENAAKDGKRIYIIVKELRLYQKEKILQYALLREYPEVKSSYIIIDPKSSHSEGLWFGGNFSSQIRSIEFILNLNPSQIKEVWGHFAHIFWNAQGNELFQGKEKNIAGIKPDLPVIPPILPNSLRVESITEFLESKPISELWISPCFPQEIHHYHAEVNRLVVQISENIKEDIFWSDLDNSEVYGCANLPFSMIKYSSYKNTSERLDYLILMDDFGFILDREQVNRLSTTFAEWGWKYVHSAKISEIEGSIILPDSDWNSLQSESLVDELPVSLKDSNSEDFDEWLRNEPKPEPDKQLRLAQEIIYSWTLYPPYLPRNAKKHRLYQRWESFHKEFKALLDSVWDNLNLALNREDEFKKIKKKYLAKKGKWKDWEKEIHELGKRNWENEYYQKNFVRVINKINEITSLLSSDLSELLEELKEKTKKKQSKKSDELDELEVLDPKISKKKMQEMKKRNELEALSHLKQNKNIEDKIPSFPLPELGTLYEEGTKWYLVIEAMNEIEPAKKIASNYQGAKVVTMR